MQCVIILYICEYSSSENWLELFILLTSRKSLQLFGEKKGDVIQVGKNEYIT
jgi:hypothetical protein